MSVRKTIIRNSLYLISGELVGKIAIFFFTVVIARVLGVADFGKYTFAVSFVLMFSVFIDFGMNVFLMREIPRNRHETSIYVGNVFGMRLVFTAFILTAVCILIYILNYPEQTRYLIYILLLWSAFQILTNAIKSSFKAAEKMEYDAGVSLLYNFLALLLVIIFFKLGFKIFGVAFSVLLASIAAFYCSIVIHSKKIARLRIALNIKICTQIIKEALPLALTGLFIAQFGRIDIVMLSWLQGDKAVGLYSAPFKLVMTMFFIYAYITQSGFPKMSEYAFSKPEKFSILTGNMLKSIVVITGFVSIMIFIFSSWIIKLVFGAEYIQATPVLNILIWINIINAVVYVFIYTLNAKNLQKMNALFVGSALGIDLVLNYILIPRFSYIGAAVSTLISEVFLAIILASYVFSKRHLNIRHFIFNTEDLRFIEGFVTIKK